MHILSSLYYENLLGKVLSNSERDNSWESAVLEWEIEDWDEDPNMETSCLCGKENIRYLFSIKNKYNNNVLDPIGSSCIKKFKRSDLDTKTTIYEKLFKLYHAIEENEYIELSSELFSRNLLAHLNQEKVFDSAYNSYNGNKDYEFILKMFNKRNTPTKNQVKKIRAIIINQIKPYLSDQLKK